ncbi:MAG: nuclear transport factor 2 family protein [Gammaproteobacteria bacterium]|nr:nuclear transport factor 2 family protein [Gammaproteobacteria bacterium]
MSEALESRLAALEAELGELRDREAIREVIHRYCQAVDRCDLDRWIETLDFRSSMLDGPNQALRGCRGADDPGNLWFDLLQHRPERPAMDDLWAGFHSLSEATRKG